MRFRRRIGRAMRLRDQREVGRVRLSGLDSLPPGRVRQLLLEFAGVFGAMVLTDWWVFGLHGFAGVEPHPFTFAVLLFALVYGAGPGLAAAFVASLLWLATGASRFSTDTDLFSYILEVSLLPLVWVILSVAVGEVVSARQRLLTRTIMRSRRIMRHCGKLENEFKDVVAANSALQLRIATEQEGLPEALDRFAALVSASTSERRNAVGDMVALAAGLPVFRLYCRSGASGAWVCAIDRMPAQYLHPPVGGRNLMWHLTHGGASLHLGMAEHREMLAPFGDIAVPLMTGNNDREVDAALVFASVPFDQMTRATMLRLEAVGSGLGALLRQFPLTDSETQQFMVLREAVA